MLRLEVMHLKALHDKEIKTEKDRRCRHRNTYGFKIYRYSDQIKSKCKHGLITENCHNPHHCRFYHVHFSINFWHQNCSC